jgi:hypothetical protein
MMVFNPKISSDGLEIRHLDGNPLNNCLTNLAWGTPAENKEDRKTHGTWGWKLSEPIVREVYVLRLFGETLGSLAKRFHTTPQTISHIFNGKTWKHVYADFFNTYDPY